MKASLFLVASGAAMAMAGPIDKRAMETDWVMEVVTVTVTQGQGGAFVEKPTVVAVPQPKPTVIVEQPEPVVTNPIQPPPKAPEPTTTQEKPEPTVITVVQPEPEPTTESKPTTTKAAAQPSQDSGDNSGSGSGSGSGAGSDPGFGNYEDAMLYHHNIHRANHTVSNLSWDNTLASYAKITAEKCVFVHDMHQGSGDYGQNLASFGGSGDIDSDKVKLAASGVTDQWYNGEAPLWTYYGMSELPSSFNYMTTGHFTQLVWKSTTKLGCYTNKCPAGSILGYESWFTVCNYNPPGNYNEDYATNVLAPIGEQMVTV